MLYREGAAENSSLRSASCSPDHRKTERRPNRIPEDEPPESRQTTLIQVFAAANQEQCAYRIRERPGATHFEQITLRFSVEAYLLDDGDLIHSRHALPMFPLLAMGLPDMGLLIDMMATRFTAGTYHFTCWPWSCLTWGC